MGRLWPIARREYLERVRSRAFIVGTLLGPAFMTALTVVPGILLTQQRASPLRIAVLDASGRLQAPVEAALAARRVAGEPRFHVEIRGAGSEAEARKRLRQAVLEGHLDGYLYLPADALTRSAAEYHGRNVSNVMDLALLEEAVEDALVGFRLSSAGLPPEEIGSLTQRLKLKMVRLSVGGEREDRGASFLLSLVLIMTLYASIAVWGAALMNGVIEEKTNRVIEVMLSSVAPSLLLGGKLLGVGLAGLTQFFVWVGCLGGLATLGAAAPTLGNGLPEMPPEVPALFVVYFLLGYFLYGALYVAIGAAVSSQHEAQSLVFPVALLLVAGMMFFPAVLARPDSALATALSLVPFWTPLLMFLRVTVLTPPAWQIALSILLTLATTLALTWAASRIYRVGILMYGKRPSLPEIMRWVWTR